MNCRGLSRFKVPWVIVLLLGANLAVYLLRLPLDREADLRVLAYFSFIPTLYLGPGTWSMELSKIYRPLTSTFLHGDFNHLAYNMIPHFIFGTLIARRMGSVYYLAFYLICGVAGKAVWFLVYPELFSPLIGASSAIHGMYGAVIRLCLQRPIPDETPPFYFNRWVTLAVVSVLVGVTNVPGFMMWNLLRGLDMVPQFAWQSHLGGLIAGFLLVGLFDGKGRRPVVV